MSFEITVVPGERRFTVAEGEVVLEAAIRAGLQLAYGCRNGSCGTCKVRLVRGEVAHRGEAAALTEHEQHEGYCLPCQAVALGDVVIEAQEIGGAAAPVVRTLPVRVARMQTLAEDVMGLWLEPPRGEHLDFRAGQYIDILLRDGRHRSFSLANPPQADGVLELHIRHNGGGAFSDHVFGSMRERELLRIMGPYGGYTLRHSGRPLLFVAGGTGFAPIKAIIEQMLLEGVARRVHLYWGVRSTGDLYGRALIEQWQRRVPEFTYTPVLSESPPGDRWAGRTGLVSQALAADFSDLSGHDVYTSGPPPMVQAVVETCRQRGLAHDRIFSDAFEFAAK